MAFGAKYFGLEKTWRASGTGTTTINAPGNYTLAHGKYELTVSGRGSSGTAQSGGNFAGNNPGTYISGNYAGANPGFYVGGNFAGFYSGFYAPGGSNPGSYSPGGFNPPSYNPVWTFTFANGGVYYLAARYNPGNPIPGTYTPGNPLPGSYYPGNAYYNSGSYYPGNAFFNPGNYTPGNPTYNPYIPAVPGQPASLLGITFPGSASGGTPAPYVPPVKVRYYDVADGQDYAATVPSGGYITVNSE